MHELICRRFKFRFLRHEFRLKDFVVKELIWAFVVLLRHHRLLSKRFTDHTATVKRCVLVMKFLKYIIVVTDEEQTKFRHLVTDSLKVLSTTLTTQKQNASV